MTLLAAHWLLPLFSMTLPAGTFRRLLDLVLVGQPLSSGQWTWRSGQPVLACAALTMMRGIEEDALADFENVLQVLQHGAETYFDATPFVEATMQYADQVAGVEFEGWMEEHRLASAQSAALAAACPPLLGLRAQLRDPARPVAALAPRQLELIIQPFVDAWREQTSLSAVPGSKQG
jgi:hypothetical protein